MLEHSELQELTAYVCRTTRLDADEAHRVVREIMGYLQETPEGYVRRRHHELQMQGRSNAAIYQQLMLELSAWRFRAPSLSERQIRRMIYG
jgi:hypothetical protein